MKAQKNNNKKEKNILLENGLNKKPSERLKTLLKEHKMKNSELADATGYTHVYISNLVTGNKPMSSEAARCISDVFHIPPEYLLGESDCKTFYEQYIEETQMTSSMSDVMCAYFSTCGLNITKTFAITPDQHTYTLIPPRIHFPHLDGKRNIKIEEKDEEITAVLQEIEIDGKKFTLDEFEFDLLWRNIQKTVRATVQSFVPTYEYIKFLREEYDDTPQQK